MNRIILIVATIFLVIAQTQTAKATHIQGMNITYEHLGGDSFIFKCDFFRYCGGTAFNSGNCTGAAGIGTTMYMQIYCPDQGFLLNNIAVTADTIKEATPICAELNSTLNSCLVGSCGLLGIQWGIYYSEVLHFGDFNVTSCSDWTFCYQSGARNTGTNYQSQPSIVAYDRMNMDNFPDNSSVQFNSEKPIPFFCNGQVVKYNWSAFDPDGDSLYWELDTAWNSWATGSFTPITYNGGYTALEPMPGVTINNQTGQLDFVAQIPSGYNFANYAIAVTVTEYDNQTGEYKGSVHRDVQFIVLDSCDNLAPVDPVGIQNFVGEGALLDSNTIEVCFGQDFEFDLIFYDYDSSGNLSTDSILSSCNIDQILPGATWTSSGTNPDTVHISWTSVPTNQRYVPFNVTVEDDFCPVTGFNVYAYVVRIVPSTFLGPDTAICELDTISLNANGGDTFYWSVLSGDPIIVGTNFGCAICAEPWIHPSQTTTYRVESNLSATCGNADTITVTVFEKFPIDLTPLHGGTVAELTYCSTDGLDTLLVTSGGGTYFGSGIVNATDGVFAPDVVDPGVGQDTVVSIIYLKQGICANSDTINLRVKGLPDASILTTGPFCAQTTSVQLQGALGGGVWSDPLNSTNPTSAGVFNPNAYANTAPDTILIFHNVDDSGCVNMDSANITVTDEYDSKVDSLPKVCAGEALLIHLNDYEGDPYGIWIGSEVTEEPAGSGNYYFNTADLRAGSYDITYKIEGECGTQSDTFLAINPLPDARIFGADSVYCDNIDDSLQLSTATPNGIWGGSMVQLHDGWFVPKQLGEGLYTISYELYDTVTTCYNKNTVDVRIARTPVNPKVFGGGPYCQGTRVTGVRGDGLLSNTYKWYSVNYGLSDTDTVFLGAGNPFDIGEVQDMPTVIYGTQVTKYGCESRFSRLEIEVLPAPNALFKPDTTRGSVPIEITFVNLSTASASIDSNVVVTPLTYLWTFGPYGTDTNEQVKFTFEDIGFYEVSLLADNGICQDSMSVLIQLDRLTSFYIPNVFTPNGDNSNDLFKWKIDGIEEFSLKIFNRWGTRVYETTELDGYWDGGKEVEGTYYYIMTGKEKTLDKDPVEYRGDVTLIRE